MEHQSPVILLSPTVTSSQTPGLINCPRTYINAITAGGGIPVLCALTGAEQLADLFDGLLLTGGQDIDPSYYHESIRFDTVKTDPERDAFEFALAKAFLTRKKPIMTICRGFQVLNVVMGGSLYQDIPEELGFVHFDSKLRHYVRTEEKSVLRELFGERFRVNSTHHQSVKALGDGLKITARSEEGIVQAYEHESLPILGTQFHPERLTMLTDDHRTPDFLPLFQHFVGMCAK